MAVTTAISSEYKKGSHFEIVVEEQGDGYVVTLSLDPDDPEMWNRDYLCGLKIGSIMSDLKKVKIPEISMVTQYRVNFITSGSAWYSSYFSNLDDTTYPVVGSEGFELHMKTHEEYLALQEQQKKTDYMAACSTYSYEQIARTPDDYKGQYAKFTGEVVRVLESGNRVDLRVNVTKGRYFYTDTIYVVYTSELGAARIFEVDIVTLYGTVDGLYTYESIMGVTSTIPKFQAAFIEMNEKLLDFPLPDNTGAGVFLPFVRGRRNMRKL